MKDNFNHPVRGRAMQHADVESGGKIETSSLWQATAPPYVGRGAASGTLDTDVAIVGAGVAGLSTAFHLGERGVETMILEAGEPGGAATGASGGILAPEFARDGIAKAVKIHGRERGERLARLVGRSSAFTFDLIARVGIECDVQARGFASPVQSARQIAALRADGDAWRSLGFPVEYLDATRTADAIGTEVYAGALLFAHGGAVNPLAYARGLATVVHRRGTRIFTQSPVGGIEREGRAWRLKLPNATVHAKRVVLAANGGNARLHALLRNLTMPLLVYEYATPPMPAAERRRHFGESVPYTDREAYVFTGRVDAAGRLISAIPEVVPPWNRFTFFEEARRRIAGTYSLPLTSVEYVWQGTAYLNASLLPAVYQPEGDDLTIVSIQACNGRGLGVNTVIGGEVAALLATGDRESIDTPLLYPKSLPMHFLASKGPKLIMSLARARERLRGRRSG